MKIQDIKMWQSFWLLAEDALRNAERRAAKAEAWLFCPGKSSCICEGGRVPLKQLSNNCSAIAEYADYGPSL